MGSGLTPRDMERLPDVLLQTVIRYCIGLPRPVQSVFGEAKARITNHETSGLSTLLHTTLCLSIPTLSDRLLTVMGL